MRQVLDLQTILSAQGATGTGTAKLVSDFKTVVFQFGTASSANLTVKFQGSLSDDCPDFSAAQTVTNSWDYIDVIDLEDGASVDGDTGVSCAGTDDFRQFEANVGGLRWICATVTARSAGSVTLKMKAFYE